MIINNFTELRNIAKVQNNQLYLYTKKEVERKCKRIKALGRKYTVFSIMGNDNPVYVEVGLNEVSNIAYLVLEGNLKFINEYIVIRGENNEKHSFI